MAALHGETSQGQQRGGTALSSLQLHRTQTRRRWQPLQQSKNTVNEATAWCAQITATLSLLRKQLQYLQRSPSYGNSTTYIQNCLSHKPVKNSTIEPADRRPVSTTAPEVKPAAWRAKLTLGEARLRADIWLGDSRGALLLVDAVLSMSGFCGEGLSPATCTRQSKRVRKWNCLALGLPADTRRVQALMSAIVGLRAANEWPLWHSGCLQASSNLSGVHYTELHLSPNPKSGL